MHVCMHACMGMRGEPTTGHMAGGGDRGKRPGYALEANELLPRRQHFGFEIYPRLQQRGTVVGADADFRGLLLILDLRPPVRPHVAGRCTHSRAGQEWSHEHAETYRG
jgi:hypothetical protein